MIKKLLIKLLGNDIYQPEQIEVKKMQEWLFKSYQEEGFKHYYTMRKKYLVNLLLLDLSDKDRAKAQGRLEELKGLSTNINSEFKRRKENDKK
jgi:hypothetical protein